MFVGADGKQVEAEVVKEQAALDRLIQNLVFDVRP